MLAPDADESGRLNYTLFAEGNLPPLLPARLDDELRKNPHYAHCRDLSQLGPLRCFQVAKNAYQTFCHALVSEGRRPGDIKPQALSVRTDWRGAHAATPSESAARRWPRSETA